MVCGIFAVSIATSAYQKLSQLNNALQIRLWLSRGRPTDGNESRTSQDIISSAAHIRRHPKYIGLPPFDRMPLESSISVLKVVSLPRYLLDLSVWLFIAAFGLYWLFTWLENIDTSGVGDRNAFIAFTIAVGLVTIYILGIRLGQANDEKKKTMDLAKSSVMIADKALAIRELEAEIKELQKDLSFMRHFGQEQVSETASCMKSTYVQEVTPGNPTSEDEKTTSRSNPSVAAQEDV